MNVRKIIIFYGMIEEQWMQKQPERLNSRGETFDRCP